MAKTVSGNTELNTSWDNTATAVVSETDAERAIWLGVVTLLVAAMWATAAAMGAALP
jgi:hypothetical protein